MLMALEIFLWIWRFFFGACIFSFLNVVVDRLPRNESIVKGRSHCDHCGHSLGAMELIPVISYLMLRGRCKNCHGKIPVRSLVVEILGGAAFMSCVYFYSDGSLGIISLEGLLAFSFICILMVVAYIDLDTQMIYDRFHILILVLGIISCFVSKDLNIVERLIGSVVISVPMLVLSILIPGAFGGGDVKLMAVSGFFLGFKAIVIAMFIALIIGGGYGTYMLVTKKLDKKDHFAFGPYLAIGLIVALFIGNELMNWYIGLL